MTLRHTTLNPLARPRLVSPRSVTLKYAFGSAIAVFCLVNIYRSTVSTEFKSSHEFLERSKVKAGPGDDSASWSASAGKRWNGSRPDVDRLSLVRVPRLDDCPPYNRTVKGKVIPVPLWQRRLWSSRGNRTTTPAAAAEEDADEDEYGDGRSFYLVELLQVRIYAEDKARWTVNELKQWMHYLFMAGVQHVYLCDHFRYDHERLDKALTRYVQLGLVTYLPWGQVRDPMTAQIKCYQRFINRYKRRHVWQMAVDIDEYPYSPNDTNDDFLIRFLQSFPHHVTEISMPNYLMLGRGDRSGRLVIERINRIVKQPNILVKPIYRPQRVNANIHHNHLLSGTQVDPSPDHLRMLHYWGARSQQWGPDTPKTLDITTEWNHMKTSWAHKIKLSLMAFGEHEAITNSTGP